MPQAAGGDTAGRLAFTPWRTHRRHHHLDASPARMAAAYWIDASRRGMVAAIKSPIGGLKLPNESQRGMVAVSMARLEAGGFAGNQNASKTKSSIDGVVLSKETLQAAADALNVGTATVDRARRVQRDGAPEVIAAEAPPRHRAPECPTPAPGPQPFRPSAAQGRAFVLADLAPLAAGTLLLRPGHGAASNPRARGYGRLHPLAPLAGRIISPLAHHRLADPL